MNIVFQHTQSTLKILTPMQSEATPSRLFHYCISVPVEEGILLHNLLTREMVLLTEEEWQNRFDNEYLKTHWFTVPEDCADKEYADLVRWVMANKQKKTNNITGYTIFTTTDCNARCFYCFELGRSRIPMSGETAHKVVHYIAEHCGGEKVNIRWFGGEPLFNKAVIDIICSGLREKGIEFTSRMVSNGYLFDKETVGTAVNNWNLKQVQITLDGTEAVYNKVKAFIYKQGSPYQTVMENIGHLLDGGVSVTIRLNMDLHNAENLLELVEDLAARFGGRKGLIVYAHHLFDADKPMADIHSYEEWEIREAAMVRLEEKITACGFLSRGSISKKLKTNFCMADSGKAVTILPNGEIGLCEHFSESEFIGHIDNDSFDQAVVNSWKERIPEIPECATCFYYPDCMQLKKCASGSVCFEHLRRDHLRKIRRAMLREYQKWQSREESSEDEEIENC